MASSRSNLFITFYFSKCKSVDRNILGRWICVPHILDHPSPIGFFSCHKYVWTNMHFGGNATDVTRNCRSVIYYDTPAKRKWVLVDNTWIAIEHLSKSQAFYLPIHTGNVLQSPDIAKFNMAARWPFWKWHCWKSIGSFPNTSDVALKFVLDI